MASSESENENEEFESADDGENDDDVEQPFKDNLKVIKPHHCEEASSRNINVQETASQEITPEEGKEIEEREKDESIDCIAEDSLAKLMSIDKHSSTVLAKLEVKTKDSSNVKTKDDENSHLQSIYTNFNHRSNSTENVKGENKISKIEVEDTQKYAENVSTDKPAGGEPVDGANNFEKRASLPERQNFTETVATSFKIEEEEEEVEPNNITTTTTVEPYFINENKEEIISTDKSESLNKTATEGKPFSKETCAPPPPPGGGGGGKRRPEILQASSCLSSKPVVVVPNRKVLHIEKKYSDTFNATKTSETHLTEKETAVMDRLCAAKEEKKISPSWSLGWSSSFISSAASSVSTFTSHVTQGFGTVMETVEASLGAPSPEELATALSGKENVERKRDSPNSKSEPQSGSPKCDENNEGILSGGLLGGLTGLSRVIESTSSKVLTGGLDTLELIGKKTMDILTEGDPGLRQKRSLFQVGSSQLTLSQVLRESRNKLDENCHDFQEREIYPVHYSKLFDEFQGLVHLEALEMLSEENQSKLEESLQLMESEERYKMDKIILKIETLCQDLPPTDDTPDEEMCQNFDKLVTKHISALSLRLSITKIKIMQSEVEEWIRICKQDQDKGEAKEAKEIYTKAIRALAELTTRAMELFHKMSEIVLVTECKLEDVQNYAKNITGLTSVLCTEVNILTSQFCQCLSTAADDSEDPDSINPLITNVFLEASNSNTYIQDAFHLLIPILQARACTSISV